MNTTVSFILPVQEELRAVEEMMRSQADGYHPDLQAALELIINAGGKRIRPALTILAGRMHGAPGDSLIFLASAIELLHTATLVHDDLIDGSLLRRGMPTLNSKWSPGATVLTGDFMFARAARLAADTNSVPVMKMFSKTLTTIVNGEIAQLLGSRCLADRESYFRRIYAKTASLFETSACSATLVSETSEELSESMRCFGHQIGMAFQIIDDILDYTGDPSAIGKPVGSDLRQGIVTLPAVIYAERYPQTPFAQALLKGRCLDGEEVDQLVELIRQDDIIQLAHQKAEEYVKNGLAYLSQHPVCQERFSLEELANYIIDRKY